ncbi:HD domain-containing protein [Deinococcus oregonensis]|uniref:HD domain-containing protein n=1 Tax=Deinococcus oregonensis TaxID=1805970 RepID=A0ABV6AYF7_9DEIO
MIHLEEDEVALMKSPEIQRLRYIRMCNINSLLLSGASETKRFEHSIGVLGLAKEWLRHNFNVLPKNQRDILRYAAMLHDIQTGPFGHSFQYLVEDTATFNFQHSNIVAGEINDFYQSGKMNLSFSGEPFAVKRLLGSFWEAVGNAIDGSGPVGSLISSSMDLDNIDNVYRMAYHMGLLEDQEKHTPIKLVGQLKLLPDRSLAITPQGVNLVHNWHEVRARVYNDLLLDWGEFSAKAMLTKAMEMALEYGIVGIESWIKTDEQLLDFLISEGVGEKQELRKLVNRLKTGDLYEPIGLYESVNNNHIKLLNNSKSKREIEESIKNLLKLAGFNASAPLIHFIEDKNKTYRSVSLRIYGSQEMITVGETLSRMLVGVFVPKEVSKLKKDHIYRGICKDVLTQYGIEITKEIYDPLESLEEDSYNGGGLFF